MSGEEETETAAASAATSTTTTTTTTTALNICEGWKRRCDWSFAQLLDKRAEHGNRWRGPNGVATSFSDGVRRKRSHVLSLRVEHELAKHRGSETLFFFFFFFWFSLFSVGCVNVAKWNERGDLLISGSDDRELNIWRYSYGTTPRLLHTLRTGHTNNIFTAHTLPLDENQTVSGGMDHQVRMCNIERGTHEFLFGADALISKVHFVPWQRDVFFTCAYDGFVRYTDLRLPARTRTRNLLSMASVGCTDASASAIAFDPIDARQFVLAGGDHRLRVFDLRAVDRVEHVFDLSSDVDLVSEHPSMVSVVASGVDWSADGLIAATYSGRPAILYDVRRGRVRSLLAAQPPPPERRRSSALASDSNDAAAAASLDETVGANPRVNVTKMVRSEGNTPLASINDEDDEDEIDDDDIDEVDDEDDEDAANDSFGIAADDDDDDDDDDIARRRRVETSRSGTSQCTKNAYAAAGARTTDWP
jgi:WD40 repeat protein